MKKIICILLIISLIFSPLLLPYSEVEAKTLRGYIEDLESKMTTQEEYERQREEARQRAKQYQTQITESFKNIEQYGEDIQASRKRIDELNTEISEKQKEIDELMSFFQITKGSNAYLEYIFGASTFTDFIYRTAIVEQLSNYNDELIDEMYRLIEEQKQVQKELEEKIKEEQKAVEEQKKLLASINVTISDLDDMYVDVEAEIKGIKEEIAYLQEMGCEMDEELADCLDVPYASGFYKPLKSGRVTSEFGSRTDPITGELNVTHKGIDIAVPDWTPVYASAAGTVSRIIRKASCGGNIVYIKHQIDGEKFTTRYIHLSRIDVSVGDIVTMNTVVGLSGGGWTADENGGYDYCTTGAHLHFEINVGWESIYPVNPRNYIYFPNRW